MSRVHPFANPIKSTRSTIGLAFTGAMLVVLLAAGLVQAAAVTVGFRDFGFDPSKAGRATENSPQSKLWFAGGFWYGGLFNAATSNYEIYRHNDATHTWVTTGDTVDTRDRTNADYLFDGTKLYAVSTRHSCDAVNNPTPGTCNDAVNFYQYSVNLANPLASQYTLDAGFPKAIIGGAYPGTGVSTGGANTVTLAKDADRIYVGWTRQSDTNAAASTTSIAYSTNAGHTTWSAPVLINQGEDGQTNTSALVAYGANVGIYYTDMHAAGADVGNFKVHTGGAAGNVWSGAEVATPNTVDNQASAKADATGNVYVAIKTGSATEQIRLLRRTSAGVWSQRGVADAASTNTRPQVAIDTTFNGGIGTAIVVMNDNAAGNGSIYYKMAPLTGAGALVYTIAGKGTLLIDSATDNDMEDATTTKQILTNASGLLVEATDQTSKFYMHGHLGLPDTFDTTGPVGTININGNPAPDATKVTGVTLNISATDPSGVVEMRIANSVDGTTCPTTGTPALLTGGINFPYATTKAHTLTAGDGVKRVCIQFRDQPLFGTPNWSVPVSDTIRLDTTAPAGTVTINGGDASTPIATVSVAVPATDATGVKAVRISNSAATTGGVLTTGTTFTPFATPQPWTLIPGDGLKTVYVQWQDALDTWSGVSSDTITLDSDDTTFTAITPVRLLDSRDNNPVGMTIFSHGVPKSFQITGRGGIPASAVAITGNLTVTGQTAAGFVTLGPDVAVIPTSSTINFPTGDNRANGVFVSLDGSGKLEATYRASGTNPAAKKAHLVLDVTGYFVPGAAGNEYFGVTPARFLDTRDNVPAGSHVLHDKAPYGFQVGGRTVGSTAIPADAVAITGNLTVTGQTKGGFLSLTPTSVADPLTSTLNFPKGDNRANNVTVKLGAGGMLFVVYRGSGTAHAVLDVTGYFRNDAAGLTFVPLAPTRTVDTRIDQGIFNPLQHGAPKSFTVRGVAGVGGDAEAFTGNVTIVGQTRAGFVSVTPTPVANPNTSTINFPKGDTRANGLAGRINPADGKASAVYRATGGPGSTQFIVDITGYFH
jgi:hypothetical protein